MKRFIYRTLVFGSILLVLHLILVFQIPKEWITHRVHENIIVENKSWFPSGFYPNVDMKMDEVGDLAYGTEYEVIRKDVIWKTDKYGFRNSQYLKNPDILFIGQSFAFGGALSQKETISESVGGLVNLNVYNLAPTDFNQFLQHIENKLIEPPRYLIYVSVERNIPYFEKIKEQVLDQNANQNSLELLTFIDQIFKSNYLKFIRSRITGARGKGYKSPSSNMFFLQGEAVLKETDYTEIEKDVGIIESYSKKCDSLGVKFLFVPIPNKETTYWELVPLQNQPNYLQLLFEKLESRNVSSLNVLELFNCQKAKNKLYHDDDTHWNSTGVSVVAQEIVNWLCVN